MTRNKSDDTKRFWICAGITAPLLIFIILWELNRKFPDFMAAATPIGIIALSVLGVVFSMGASDRRGQAYNDLMADYDLELDRKATREAKRVAARAKEVSELKGKKR